MSTLIVQVVGSFLPSTNALYAGCPLIARGPTVIF